MYRTPSKLPGFLVALFLTSTFLMPVRADLVLETETAELGHKGEGLFSMALQFEKEKDGSRTIFTLNQFEYAVTDRGEILIEPFFKEWDRPKGEARFSGMGDLEITPSYMVVLEKPYVPAIVLAFKLKVPTAKNRNIGTGRFDYQPYVIFGKSYGHWVFNANFGYDIITSPAGEGLKNQFIYDFSVEYKITESWSVFAEVFANSKPTVEEKGTFAGAIATEYQFGKHFNAFASVGYDSDHLLNFRPGINIPF
ncbi:MAG: hypothetical protein JWL59_2418 [Chthoniobacteraceae bacterium]|nr:hypothetical protein [Chthoniobacteraceae bacterium]